MLCMLVRLCLSYSLSVWLGLCITLAVVRMGFKVIVMHTTLHLLPLTPFSLTPLASKEVVGILKPAMVPTTSVGARGERGARPHPEGAKPRCPGNESSGETFTT